MEGNKAVGHRCDRVRDQMLPCFQGQFDISLFCFFFFLDACLLQALQSLSLTDSRLRSRGTILVNALGSNTCLRKVDLSGNNMDDIGAKMLSKALQINTTLR